MKTLILGFIVATGVATAFVAAPASAAPLAPFAVAGQADGVASQVAYRRTVTVVRHHHGYHHHRRHGCKVVRTRVVKMYRGKRVVRVTTRRVCR